MDEIERSERSPHMKAEYLHIARIQALFVSSATGVRISLQNNRFCRDDALRLFRQAVQEIRRRLPERNGEYHNGISTSSPVSWIRPISSTSRRFSSLLEHILYQFREDHLRLPHGPDLFPDNNALCGIHSIDEVIPKRSPNPRYTLIGAINSQASAI